MYRQQAGLNIVQGVFLMNFALFINTKTNAKLNPLLAGFSCQVFRSDPWAKSKLQQYWATEMILSHPVHLTHVNNISKQKGPSGPFKKLIQL